jgi:ABC-type spermidine/putrescine transport system permease subunit II
MSRLTERALGFYVFIACAALMLPIAIVIVLAFSGQSYLKFPPDSFSLRWFAAFFGDGRWRASLGLSLAIALIACIVSTVLGFLAAYALVRSDIRNKTFLLSLMLMPMIVPTVVTSIALYFLSASLGLIGNVVWIGCCHAVIALPIVLLILLSTLQGVDLNLERAALSLGASRLRVFLKVVMPLAAPGLVSAALFAFLASFDELLISLFLTNVRDQTLPVRIWNSLHLDVEPTIAAVNAFLIGVTGVVLLIDALFRRRGSAVAQRS